MMVDFLEDAPLLKTLAPARKSGPGRLWGTSPTDKSYCGVINCSSCTLSSPDLWFFKLPVQSQERREAWLSQIGRPDIQLFHRVLVCEKHFKPSDIIGTPNSKRRLIKQGVNPTLLLPTPNINGKLVTQRNTSEIKVYKRTKTTQELNATQEFNTKQELNTTQELNANQELNASQELNANQELNASQELKTTQKFNATKEISPMFSVSRTLGNKTMNSFTKLNMFKLYLKNAQLYKLLQSMLGLPPVSMIPSFIPSTIVDKNEVFASSLKGKLSLKPLKYKYGILCMSLMKIQPYIGYDYKLDVLSGVCEGSNVVPIQYAVVAMVRGITEDWHHIASIHFIAELDSFLEFNVWLEKLINTMNEIGINIKAIVTSTDDFFIKVFAFLEPFLKNKNLRCFFDPLSLMLLLYEELKNGIIKFDHDLHNKIAKWKYISNFYEYDSTRKFRLTHRSSYINPDDLQQNKLKSAAEILGLRTATGISTFVDMQLLNKQAMDTVEFILKINSILAALYPNAVQPEDKHLLTQNDGKSWDDDIEFLNSIKFTKVAPEVKPKKIVNCFKKCIESIKVLRKSTSLSPFASVLTRNLNQNPLTAFIHEINLKCFKHKHPTMNEFLEIINHSFMQNNFHNMDSELKDVEGFIKNSNKISEQDYLVEVECKKLKPSRCSSFHDDYTEIDHEDASSMFFVATYLLDKMDKKYKNAVSSRMISMSSRVHYENRKTGKAGICGSLIIPNNDFLEFVNNMDSVFAICCKEAIASGSFYVGMMKKINKFVVKSPIHKTPLEYVKGLFIKLRIYHTIKYNNYVYETDDGDPQEFIIEKLRS